MKLYVPSMQKNALISESGHPPIYLKDHFFLACKDPLLSFRNSPVICPPGPQYTFYQAVRLEEPATIAGVNISNYESPLNDYYTKMLPDYDMRYWVTQHARELPAGSLVLREFDRARNVTTGGWFAMTREQEIWQNLQRVHLSSQSETLSTAYKPSLSSWPDDVQRRAQRKDIALIRKLENDKTAGGRALNWLQAHNPVRILQLAS